MVRVIIITNNPMMRQAPVKTLFCAGPPQEVLVCARDMVHRGHRLLAPPQLGGVPPGQAPYRTVVLSETPGELDVASLTQIEQALDAARSFTPGTLPEKALQDYQFLDYTLAREVLAGCAAVLHST